MAASSRAQPLRPSTPAKRARPTGEPGPRFLCAGLDFLVANDGEVRLLEVNDHPVGLCASKPLPDSGVSDPGRALAEAILRRDPGREVTLVLPDFYRIGTRRHIAEWLDVVAPPCGLDVRIDRTRQEFNAVAGWIRALGGSAVIADVRALSAGRDGRLRCAGRRVVKLFRRANQLPGNLQGVPCYNSRELRALCGDKLLAHDCLAELCPSLPQVAVAVIDLEDARFRALLDAAVRTDAWLIVKPRWGAASEGVRRMRATALVRHLATAAGREEFTGRAWVAQPWIEPLRVPERGRDYYADLRVYFVGGTAVSAVLRRACVPVSGLGTDTPLAWLTTTGAAVPLDAGWFFQPRVPAIDRALLRRIGRMGARIVDALERACRSPARHRELRVPSPQRILATRGRIRLVRLQPGAEPADAPWRAIARPVEK